jgi:catechol 2,3-dioxygenase-like lactoylglutathione lyase family enzyme
MFNGLAMHATLPASDYERAKAWYSDKLGLTPVEEEPGNQGAWYETGGAQFLVYESGFAGTNQATSASFRTDDFDAAIAQLRASGVVLEEYDFEGFKTVDGVLTTPEGNRGAWFKDSEGNILAISDM